MTDLNIDGGTSLLRRKRGWLIVLGIALVALGGLAFANLYAASIATIYYVGVLMIAGAAVQMVLAFPVNDWHRAAFLIGGAIFYGLAGLFAFMDPLLASVIVTLLLAAMLLASGIVRVILALRERPRGSWSLLLATGVLTILMGLIVMAGWPVNSLWVLGLFLAADLIAQGLGWLFVGIALGRR